MKRERGFTIVELLIVIVVIAVLAAITIVAYNGIQSRAHDTTIQSDLRGIGQQISAYKITEGTLPVSVSEFSTLKLKVSPRSYGSHYGGIYNMAYCRNAADDTFSIVAASTSGKVFVFQNGSVKEGVGPIVTIATTCSNNGGTITTVTSDAWLYYAGSWRSYINSAS